jgi:hypothetical protein
MKFAAAKQEFQIRCYYWATSEFEKEISEVFPHFRLFKNGPIWATHQFMRGINRSEQLILAHALLKRFHPDAAKMLNESLSDEASSWLDKFDKFRSQFYGLAGREVSSKAGKTVSKSKIRKAMVAAFKEAFGDRCVRIQTGTEWDPWFEMRFSGWIVTTRFAFGRRESLISYYHSIESEAKIPNPEFPPDFWMPTMRLGHLISFAAWLGISSQTQWEYLMEEDVETACNIAAKLCGIFFQVAPDLLKGLEFEKMEGT